MTYTTVHNLTFNVISTVMVPAVLSLDSCVFLSVPIPIYFLCLLCAHGFPPSLIFPLLPLAVHSVSPGGKERKSVLCLSCMKKSQKKNIALEYLWCVIGSMRLKCCKND